MSHFDEENLREFLLALMASGTRPSPSLVKSLTKLSGVDEAVVETLFREIFGTLDPTSHTARLQDISG